MGIRSIVLYNMWVFKGIDSLLVSMFHLSTCHMCSYMYIKIMIAGWRHFSIGYKLFAKCNILHIQGYNKLDFV